MNPITLAFPDAATEREYAADFAVRSRNHYRMALTFLVLGTAAVIFIDSNSYATPEQIRILRQIRYLLVEPILLLCLAFSFAPRRIFVRGLQPAVSLVGIVALLATIVPGWVIAPVPPELEHVGMMFFIITVFLVHLVLPIRFVWATAAALIVSAIFVLGPRVGSSDRTLPLIFFMGTVTNSAAATGSYLVERYRRDSFLQRREILRERSRSDALLLNILPAEIAERLKAGQTEIADAHAAVSVLFADIVGFTPMAAKLSPKDLVALLNRVFSAVDELVVRHHVEKIKTIGDAYMVVAGVPTPRADHAAVLVAFAIELRETVSRLSSESGHAIALRMGIASGPVVAGVIGRAKFAYDLWGDTVNTASRMESQGVAGQIQLSESTWMLVRDSFDADERGALDVKGLGTLRTWLVRARRAA